jgi:hypothetical protein
MSEEIKSPAILDLRQIASAHLSLGIRFPSLVLFWLVVDCLRWLYGSKLIASETVFQWLLSYLLLWE